MKRNVMIAGSYPMIITSGGNPRVNRELVDNVFLKTYVSELGELLKVKGKLEDIKIVYVGGYSKEENVSRAKLYISAYNYYLNYLGYGTLSKSNLTVVDIQDGEEVLEKIEQCDLLFLGIGADSRLFGTIASLENIGVKLNELVENKNILVSSICSGSVMSAEKIYGGMYDHYYYGKDVYEYPLDIPSLRLNPVTMETDFCPNDATEEQNEKFIREYLLPDSYKCVFFACRPNSMFFISDNKIFAYGEMYLFVDGCSMLIESDLEKADVTELVLLVNKYNELKNRNMVTSEDVFMEIKFKVEQLCRIAIDTNLGWEKEVVKDFETNEKRRNEENNAKRMVWKSDLKRSLDCLFSVGNSDFSLNASSFQEMVSRMDKSAIDSFNVVDSSDFLEELYMKMKLVSILKKAYFEYFSYYSDFKRDLYDLVCEYVSVNDKLVEYVIETCGCLFSNRELKYLLGLIEYEKGKRPQQIINSTEMNLRLFRKGVKYERS